MSNFTIRIEGLDEARALLAKYPERARKEFGEAISKTVRAVKVESQRRSPVDTGRMRTSINVVRETPTEGEVAAGVNYAIFVHEGTRHMRGRPFMRDAVTSLEAGIKRFFTEAAANIFK
jgi:HK97 gp10 family phage protein